MKYFTYMGKSSLNITDQATIIGSISRPDEWTTGSKRKNMVGERTYYRPVANEFGTVYNDILTIKFGLVKCNGLFTYEEQIAIETWLTSPLLSRWLYVYDTEDPSYCIKYFGKVVSTQWSHYGNGFIAVDFDFETNAPYPWQQYTFQYRISNGVPQTYRNNRWITNNTVSEEGLPNINGYEPFVLNLETDDLENVVYPVITFLPGVGESPRVTFSYTCHGAITNATLRSGMNTTLDCRNLILKDEAGLVDFEDWGWDDVDAIYWPKLIYGKNTIILETDADLLNMTITCDTPYKKVGGWI